MARVNVTSSGGGSGAVSSVAGRTGAVVLTAADVGAGQLPAGVLLPSGVVIPSGADISAILGATSATAAAGNDSRLSDTRTPTDGSVTNAKVANGAAIALAKLATDPLARANHTGTQLMATISDAGALATKSAVASADITDGTIVGGDLSSTIVLPSGATATTQTASDNSTKLATTAYADAIAALKANLASPTFTGTPAAPTAAVDTNTTQLATTAMVLGQAAAATPAISATAAAVGTSTRYARADHVHANNSALSPTGMVPADMGLKGWSWDPGLLTGSFTLSTTTVYLARMPVPATITVTNVEVLLANTPAGSSYAAAAIYDSTGAQTSLSADLHTTFNGATGRFVFPQTGNPITVTGGSGTFVWLAILVIGASTAAQMYRLGNAATAALNYNLTASQSRYGTYTTGSPTTLAGLSLTPANISQVANATFMGVS